MVFQFVVFDNCQGLEGLAQTDAVGDDAAAMHFYFVNGPFDPITLERKEGVPYPGVEEMDPLVKEAAHLLVDEKLFKDMVECLEVDEFRVIFLVKLAR